MSSKIFAQVPEEFQKQEIRWVVISPDDEEVNAVSVFQYTNIKDRCLYDQFFECIEDAKEWCKEIYNVEQWLSESELKKRGITDISDDR